MNLSVGIVGLPNVGKSTLFNALLKKQQAFVANYPFATIEPNVGIVPVPDKRLEKLAEIIARNPISISVGAIARHPEGVIGKVSPIVPATVSFVDIAGLVKGASEGAGLGNKFLSHIREASIIAHVVRAFADPTPASGQAPIIREGSVDPKTDYEIIKTELILADLQTIQNAQSRIKKFQDQMEKSAIEKLYKGLNEGKPAREIELSDEENAFAKTFFLLSQKPELIVLNVSEQDYSSGKFDEIYSRYTNISAVEKGDAVIVCAKIESELSELSEVDEQKEYLNGLGLKESGLERLIMKAYDTLGLISFLTAGEKEVRAWTIEKGTKAVDAAGVIHTDFTKNFIKAEVISFDDFVKYGGWKKARSLGKTGFKGRDYIMQDGDVVEFKIGS